MKKNNIVGLYITFLLVIIGGGCSGNLPMQGRVTFYEDGSPVTDGVVNFESDTFKARGKINENGIYVMGSHKTKDGLPPGTYRVSVTGFNLYVITNVELDEGYDLPIIDTKYESGWSSGIEFVIDGKTKNFDFSVTKNPAYLKQISKQNSKK